MKLKHLLSFLFLIILLIEGTVLSVVTNITQKNMNSEAVKNSETLLEYYANQLETQMDYAQKDLRLLGENKEVLYEESYAEPVEQWYFEKLHLKKYMQNVLDLNSILDGILFYQKDTEAYYAYSSKYTNYEQELQLKEWIINGEPAAKTGYWFWQDIADAEYLLYLENGLYGWYGIWINASSILQNFERLSPQSQYGLYICDLEGEILESQSSIPFSDLFLQADNGSTVKINKKNYIKVVSKITRGDYVLAALLLEEDIMKEMSAVRPVLIVSVSVSLILLLLCIAGAKKFIYEPLRCLTDHMEQVKTGDLETKLPVENHLEEFNEVYSTFNEMQKSIITLKLDNYERRLQEEQTKRQFLQSQIKSHFFLNCLNIIYMLAQGKQYELIQKLDLCMANYMRYLTRPAEQPVTLEQELMHIRNYMEIQGLRYPGKIAFSCEVEAECMNQYLIYPLMIQTFVENSVKYAMDPEREDNKISVRIMHMPESKEKFSVCIEDDGEGFTTDLLKLLNQDTEVPLNGLSGVGIANVKCRLKLFYKEEGKISFSNNQEHGAKVELQIPVRNEKMGV